MGVPSVYPSKTPDSICTRSGSCRGVETELWPGRRRPVPPGCLRPASGSRGGQPLDHDADPAAVGFAKGGDAEGLPECIPMRHQYRTSHCHGSSRAGPHVPWLEVLNVSCTVAGTGSMPDDGGVGRGPHRHRPGDDVLGRDPRELDVCVRKRGTRPGAPHLYAAPERPESRRGRTLYAQYRHPDSAQRHRS